MPSPNNVSRRCFLGTTFGVCLTLSAGCGLLLYPERRGQPAGRLDWGVVLLDGLGLLLFFIPGIIAFAVDFATGTIYLPPERDRYGQARPDSVDSPLVAVHVPRDQLTRARVEEIASEHVGRPIQLVDGAYQTEPLREIKDFWKAIARRTTGTA